jgi:cytidine deaminase
VAVQTAVAALGPEEVEISEVVVVTAATPPWPPCGFCRQVLAEFGSPATEIHAAHSEQFSLGFSPKFSKDSLGTQEGSTTLGALLPDAFTPHHLIDTGSKKTKTKSSVKKTRAFS